MPPVSYEEPTLQELLWAPDIWGFYLFVVFVFGALLGSFYNVCIYRIPLGLSPGTPKWSFCFRCGTPIRWYDNIPILSYFVLGGKCRACGSGYSLRYAAVEFLTAALFVAVFVSANPLGSETFAWATFWYLAFVSLLIVGTFTDLDHWIIPDGVTLGGALAGIVFWLLFGLFVQQHSILTLNGPFPLLWEMRGEATVDIVLAFLDNPTDAAPPPGAIKWWMPVANSVLGALFGMGMLWGIAIVGKVMFGKDAMGFGDVKLFALVGATLGIRGAILTLMAACVFGVIAGVTLMLAAKMSKPKVSVLRAGGPLVEEGVLDTVDSDADVEPGATEAKLDWRGRLARRCREEIKPSNLHHLPFGPWIALGAAVVLLGRL